MMHIINYALCAFCTTLFTSDSFFSICVHETQIFGFITELICQVCHGSFMMLLLLA